MIRINQSVKRIIALATAIFMLLAIVPCLTYVAKAEDKKTVHVRIDPNGGRYIRNGANNSSIQDFSMAAGDYLIREEKADWFSPLDADLWAAPRDSNLVFDGWTKDKEGKIPLEYGGTHFAPNKDITLYAKWVKPSEQKNYVTLVFDDNNYSTFVSDDPIHQISTVVKKGSIIDAPALNAEYESFGWYSDKECTKLVPRINNEFYAYSIIANDSVTLYAGAATYHSITLNASEGSFYGDKKVYERFFLEGQTLSDILYVGEQPELENKILAGWYYDKSCTKRVKASDELTDNMTLYAKWSDPVTIILNVGSCTFSGITSNTIDITISADLPLSQSFDYLYDYSFVSKDKKSAEHISDTTKVYSDSALKNRIDLTKTYPSNNTQYYLDLTPQVVLVGFYCGEGGLSFGDMPSDFAAYVGVGVNNYSLRDFIIAQGLDICTPGESVIEGFYKDEQFKEKYPDHNIVFTTPTFVYIKYKPSSSATNSDDKDDENKPAVKLNGLVQGPDGKWAMYKNGAVDTTYTGVANNKYGWWRVEKGYVNFNANGVYKNENGWWKTTNGKVTFKENGVFQNENGWWRVKDSKVDFKAQGIYQNNHGWWKTTNGKVTFKENGVFQNENGWWKVKDSKVDFKFTGIASNKNGSWFIKEGKVDFSKTGDVNYAGKTYRVTEGKAILL